MGYFIDENGYVKPENQKLPTKKCPECNGEMRERIRTRYSEPKTREKGLSPYLEIIEDDIWSCRNCDYSELRE